MASLWDNYTKYSGWDQIMNMLYPSYTNPATGAMPYLNQIPGIANSAYAPYMNTGQNALGQYYGNASAWSTPQGAMNNYNTVAAGWNGSPAQQYDVDQATQAQMQAAAASGQAGTPSTQAAVAQQTENISNKYMQDYLNSIFGMQNQGQQQLGDISHMGLQASNMDVDTIVKALMSQAGLSYAGQMNQNAANKQPTFLTSSLYGLTSPLSGLI